MSNNLSHLLGRDGHNRNLFEALGDAASSTGTPDIERLEALRQEFLVGKSTVYGAVSFYDFLKPENKGKKIYVCNGSSCLTAGTQDAVLDKVKQFYGADEIGEMCCLGRCHENSSFHVNGQNFSGTDIDDLMNIKKGSITSSEKYFVGSKGAAILTSEYPAVSEYYHIFLDCLKKSPSELISELKDSGLRGRGGAGFSMAFKLDSCRNAVADSKFIVCNADEGDPGAYSDRYIMENRPHALLMGMMIAGYIAGADCGVVYIRGEYPESVTIISDAVGIKKSKFIG